ncbi:MAG: hypothetical protein AAGA30_13495 [Planctomycetota bacterium]
MSLLFRRRNRDSQVQYYFVPFDPLFLVVLVAFSIGFTFSVWVAFCRLVQEWPQTVVAVILAAFIIGLTSFAIAKISVMRRGTLMSVGPKLMTLQMNRCYLAGYFIMSIASLLVVFFVMAA